MTREEIREAVRQGQAVLGLELGSTRIKAVLIGPDHAPIATGAFDWENRLENGVWTYSLEDAWKGIQAAYARNGPGGGGPVRPAPAPPGGPRGSPP